MAKIIVCDDDQGMCNVIASAMKHEGYNVLSVNDGAQAIEMAKTEEPDLMILDIRLPDMDGIQVLTEVKKQVPGMAVIMISGIGEIENAVQAMKLGAYEFISKPFKIEDMAGKVRNALASRLLKKDSIIEHEQAAESPVTLRVPAKPKKTIAGSGSRKPVLLWAGIAVAAGIAIVAGSLAVHKLGSGGSTKAEYGTPYANPTALAFSDKYLWASDWFTQSIYQHNIDDKLSVAHIYYIQDSHFSGLAWDGMAIWSCNSWAKEIYRHRLDDRLSIANTFTSPGPEPSGLCWDGVNLWICDSKLGKFFKTKVGDSGLSVIATYEAPGTRPVGLYFDGKDYYSADGSTNRIYKHSPADMRVVEVLVPVQYEGGTNKISGIAWDGHYVWTCAEGTQKIFRHSAKDFKKLSF